MYYMYAFDALQIKCFKVFLSGVLMSSLSVSVFKKFLQNKIKFPHIFACNKTFSKVAVKF